MNYGIKYHCRWQSPMREQRDYDVFILEADYVGDIFPLHLTGDAITITQGLMDASELEVFKPSEAEVEILCIESGNPYMALFTTDPLKYMLRITRSVVDEDGERRTYDEWRGFLDCSTYVQDYAREPYRVTLRAVDGLAILKDMPWLDDNGERFRGLMTLDTIVRNILGKLPNDFDVEYNIDDNIIDALQDVSTMELLSLDASAVYTSFGGEDVPSCYDVLRDVLSSLQLQIFQSYGRWHIRSSASLYNSRKSIGIGTYPNNGGEMLPLSVAGSDEGMSIAASMSLLAPLRSMSVERPELEAESSGGAYPQALRPEAWVPCFEKTKMVAKAWKGKLRLKSTLAKRWATKYSGVALLPDIVSKSSAETSMTISAELYNLHTSERNIQVALFAYPADKDIKSSFFDLSRTAVNTTISLWYWDASNSVWMSVPAGRSAWSALANAWQTITLPAAKHIISFDQPSPLSYMVKHELSVEAANLSVNTVNSVRFALCVCGGANQTPLSAIELRNVDITLASNLESADDVVIDGGEVCATGLEELTYEQRFADGWMSPTKGFVYQAPFVRTDDGDMLRGMVSPTDRPLLADTALANLRTMRGNVTRQLDGEVYVKAAIDLNAKWQDDEGRRYYTNYIRRHLRRGVYTVQLRELPEESGAVSRLGECFAGTVGKVIGLDTSCYWINNASSAIHYVDIASKTSKVVCEKLGTNGEIVLNEGQRCVSIASKEYNEELGVYAWNLYAYDTTGKLLSSVEAVDELFTNVAAGGAAGLAKSAKYDANVSTWVLAHGVANETNLLILSSDGGVLANTKYTASDRVAAVSSTLMPNGFIYESYSPSVGDGKHRSWWHNNAKHVDAVVELLGVGVEVLAMNERFVVIAQDNKIKAHARNDIYFGYDATPLYECDATNNRFVAMNNALIVTRTYAPDSPIFTVNIFDARTGRSVQLSSFSLNPIRFMWLSGNALYTARGLRFGYDIQRNTIAMGDGSAWDYYITADGERYITADGYIYKVTR